MGQGAAGHWIKRAWETKTGEVRTAGETRLYADMARWGGTSILMLALACMIYEYRNSWVGTQGQLRGERKNCRRLVEHSVVRAPDHAETGGAPEIRTHTSYICPMTLTYQDQHGNTVKRAVQKTFYARPHDAMMMNCAA